MTDSLPTSNQDPAAIASAISDPTNGITQEPGVPVGIKIDPASAKEIGQHFADAINPGPLPPVVTLPWWKATLFRALRTALVVAIPYLGAIKFADIPWLAVVSTVALAFIASVLTSLVAGIPETFSVSVPTWLALTERTVKTFAQSVLAGFGTAVLFQQVHWTVVLQAAAIAAAGSLLMGVLGFLPESPQARASLARK